MSEQTAYLVTGSVTSGKIRKVTVPHVKTDGDGRRYFYGNFGSEGLSSVYDFGRDLFDTEAEALAFCEAKRVKKIASLERQIMKLNKMEFVVE